MKILIIEDEKKVGSLLKRGLEDSNYTADLALTGEEGVDLAFSYEYQLIILDINLPDINGIEVCTKIRAQKSTPILMLTALGTVDDKVNGLDAGADDYLLKPFQFRELLARVRALTRRPPLPNDRIYRIANLELDLDTKSVIRGGKRIDLTAKEYGLLEFMMKNKGKVLSRADIAENVWDLNFDTGTNIIDVYINYLRKKVDRGYSPKLIHTLIGLGYILKEED
ncbi:MAG: response regulator transcription factor [Sporocytophaga sp.]|nr:response regulator transcription factor [Sporocytophaga sp.]